jgi:DNA-binding IclR family transcriptional regulator
LEARVLKRLLGIVADGQVGSTAELAAALGTSPLLVEAMLEQLERQGLLQRTGDCGVVCAGCPAEASCAPRATARAWMLTTAGRRHATA